MAITRPNTGNGHAPRGPRRQPRAASDTVIKLRRTETPDEPPVGLQVGEPSVEIASTPPKLWIGVPTTINAAGRALVAGAPTLPAGGAVNEVLTKASATDRDVEWRAVGIALGSNSTAIGVDALAVNTGNFNVAYGNNALTSNTATSGNTAVGANALQACVTNWNTAVGFTSLGALASGEHNTALGFQAAQSVVDANHSTFIGFRARPAGEGQTNQLVIGYDAVGNGSHTITLGDGQVVALHTRAGLVLDSATGGSQGLGTVNSKGLFVDGVGVTALPSGGAQYTVLTKASATDRDVEWRGPGARPGNITVLGQRTGTNAGSVNNTVIGFNAYNSAGTSGSANVAIGSNALLSGVNVNNNTAVGANALAMTQAGGNVAVGAGALQSSTAVTDSVAVGSQALSQAPNSAGDTAVGASAASFTRGVENTVVGHLALAGSPHDGDCNIAIGVWAGRYWGATLSTDHNTNSAGSIFIGCRTQPLALNQTNQIVIGHEAIGSGSHTVTMGNADVTALHTRGMWRINRYPDQPLNAISAGIFPRVGLQIQGAQFGSFLVIDGIGASCVPTLFFRRANGTPSAPSYPLLLHNIGRIAWGQGAEGSLYADAFIDVIPQSAWTSTERGVRMEFHLTAPGGFVGQQAPELVLGGGAVIGSTTARPADMARGDLSARRLFVTRNTVLMPVSVGSPATAAWTEGTDPDRVVFLVNNTGYDLTCTAITGLVEQPNGVAALVDVYYAEPGQTMSAATKINDIASFDANGTAGTAQVLRTAALTIAAGGRLGLRVVNADATDWDESIAIITAYIVG